MKGRMTESSKTILGVAIVVILAFGFLVGTNTIKLGGAKAEIGGQFQEIKSGTGQKTTAPSSLCQGITSLVLSVASRNTLNNSLQYQAGAWRIDAASDGRLDATGTGTAGSALSYVTINVPCSLPNSVGTAYVMSSTALNSNKGTYAFTSGTGTTVILEQRNANLANFTMYNSSATASASPTATVVTETVPTPMSAGDTRNGKIDVQPGVNLYSQYGGTISLDDLPALKPYINFNPGLVWFVDTVDAAAFTDNGIALGSTDANFPLVEIPLTVCNSVFGKGASVRSANRCYVSKPIPTGMPTTRLTYVVSNDGGTNAGTTSDPVVYIDDIQYFEDTDGMIKVGTHDSAGTNIGSAGNSITFDNS